MGWGLGSEVWSGGWGVSLLPLVSTSGEVNYIHWGKCVVCHGLTEPTGSAALPLLMPLGIDGSGPRPELFPVWTM